MHLVHHLSVLNHIETSPALPTRFVVAATDGYSEWMIEAELGATLTDAGRKIACDLTAKYIYKRSVRICTVDAAGKLHIC